MQAIFMRAFIEPSEDNWKQLRDFSESMDLLGGDRSIRGYAPGAIGILELNKSASRHEAYAGYFANVAKVELRFPITKKRALGNISGAVFVDQGMLVPCSALGQCMEKDSLEKIVSRSGFGLSVGAALRYNLPVGPISLDYGISPLNGEGRFHLYFGFSF